MKFMTGIWLFSIMVLRLFRSTVSQFERYSNSVYLLLKPVFIYFMQYFIFMHSKWNVLLQLILNACINQDSFDR